MNYFSIDRFSPEFPFVGNIFCSHNFFFLRPNNVKVIPIFAFIKVSFLQLMKTASNSCIDQSQFFLKPVPCNVKVQLFRR